MNRLLLLSSLLLTPSSALQTVNQSPKQEHPTSLEGRRQFLGIAASILSAGVLLPSPATADNKSFAPGGTLVDYQVGVNVGNAEANLSRKPDNSNVVFGQDYYYKFGTAPTWVENGSTDFPKTMPFTPSQQRYDTLKKYGARVLKGVAQVSSISQMIENNDFSSILDGSAPEYYIRPMGLMANGFLASENTGTTNELLLARWYINEISLDIDDVKNAKTKKEALAAFNAAKKATNSYVSLINRVITSKIGDKLELI